MNGLRWVASVACLTALTLAAGQRAFAQEGEITVKQATLMKDMQDSKEQIKRKEAEEKQGKEKLAEARKAFRHAAASGANADELKKLDQSARQASVARDNARIEKIRAEDKYREATIAAKAAGIDVPPREADQPDGLGPRQQPPRSGLGLNDEFLDEVKAVDDREKEGSSGSLERQSQFLQSAIDGARTHDEAHIERKQEAERLRLEADRLAREAELRRQEQERQRKLAELRRQEQERQRKLAERRSQEEMRRRQQQERARVAKEQEIKQLRAAILRLAATADQVRQSGSRARVNSYNAEFDRLMNRLRQLGVGVQYHEEAVPVDR